MDRYAGKPFLRLLECYVLFAIGQLDEHQQETLQHMEPKLADVYNLSGTWLDIVSSQMAFPDLQSAIDFVKSIGWEYYVVYTGTRYHQTKSYADNLRYKKSCFQEQTKIKRLYQSNYWVSQIRCSRLEKSRI